MEKVGKERVIPFKKKNYAIKTLEENNRNKALISRLVEIDRNNSMMEKMF